MKTNLFFIFALSVLITSCYSSKSIIDDDVYVVKANTLPVGESLTDEASYSTYLYRNHHEVEANTSYYYDRQTLNYSNFYFSPYFIGSNGMGYSPYGINGQPPFFGSSYGINYPYGGYYGDNGYGGNGYYGNNYGYGYYGNNYYGNNYYGNNYYSNGYYGNGYYGNNYGYGYYGNNYYGGYGGYGGWNNSHHNSATSGTFYNSTNHHVGARGSYGSVDQSPSRSNPYLLKSGGASQGTGREFISRAPYSTNRTPLSRQGMSESTPMSRPSRNSTEMYRPTNDRPATSSGSGRESSPTEGGYNNTRSNGERNNDGINQQRIPSQPNRGGGTTSPSRGGESSPSSPSPSSPSRGGGGTGSNNGSRRN
jgi:hypothetical protein